MGDDSHNLLFNIDENNTDQWRRINEILVKLKFAKINMESKNE